MPELEESLTPKNIFKIPWFLLGILAIFLFSIALRFWGLSRFNTPVFDEITFGGYANNYLIRQQFFENHPPLGNYFITIGIWLDTHNPFSSSPQSTNHILTLSELNSFSYRWFNALTGSFIPLIVGGIAYQLSRSRSYTLIAALFTALDGLFLVESRYALINIYLVIWGLLGQWLFLLALSKSSKQRQIFLILAGISFGACVGVKWNGLAFLQSIYLLWIIAKIIDYWQNKRTKNTEANDNISSIHHHNPLKKLAKLNIIDLIVELGIIPLIVYILIWIPHLQLNNNMTFWQWHKYAYESHIHVGNSADVHPYCSAWYSWPLMMRPVAYYFQQINNNANSNAITIYNVHGMGNPVLWWFSAIAIVIVFVILILRLSTWFISNQNSRKISSLQKTELWVTLYLVVNYAFNFLPWAKVTRCLFIYHYMSPSIFAFLALAWLVHRCLRSQKFLPQLIAGIVIFFTLSAFMYWLPFFLGLPLSRPAFEARMLFRSWY